MIEAQLWAGVAEALRAGRPVALAVLAARSGSAPGRVGCLLTVIGAQPGPAAAPLGTVGGGPAESQIIELARELLVLANPRPRIVELAHNRGARNASGLECGGTSTYVVWRMPHSARGDVAQLSAMLADGGRASWSVGPQGWARRAATVRPGLARHGPDWSFEHASGPHPEVFLIGGGHIGLALSGLLAALEFRVTVVEERPGVATFTANTAAHTRIVADYGQLTRTIAPGTQDLALIATHDPSADRRALEALLHLPLRYLGVLGSRAKLNRLLAGRVVPSHVHAPAGLPIASQTPQEIAISVAAQMVAIRNGALS